MPGSVWRPCTIFIPRDDLLSAEAIVKSQARSLLKHNYVRAITALLIVLLPFYIIDGTTTAISCALSDAISDGDLATVLIYSIGYSVEIIMGFLYSPVINGYVRAFYKAAYSGTIDLKDVFYHFQRGRYGSALSLNIRLILRMLLPILILYSPLIIFEIIASNTGSEFYGSVLYFNCHFLFSVLSTITTTLYSLRYFTVLTVSADNPQFTPKQVFAYNKYIMQDHTGNAAKLILSFTPWMLLCLLVLPMLYVIPYMTTSLCISAKWMTKASLEVN